MIRIVSISLLVLFRLQMAASGQTNTNFAAAETSERLQEAASEKLTRSHGTFARSGESDSLMTKRTFFSTAVSQQGNRLRRRSVIQLMEDEDVIQAQILYNQSLILKPIGPVLIASGVVLGYIAVKGTPKTAFAKGIGTPANPSPPDVPIEYTSRNLPMLMGGIGLLIGGLCLVEIANGQTAKSIKLYNARVFPRKSVSTLKALKLGISTSGNIGIEAIL